MRQSFASEWLAAELNLDNLGATSQIPLQNHKHESSLSSLSRRPDEELEVSNYI
jgi:hypothetical protein